MLAASCSSVRRAAPPPAVGPFGVWRSAPSVLCVASFCASAGRVAGRHRCGGPPLCRRAAFVRTLVLCCCSVFCAVRGRTRGGKRFRSVATGRRHCRNDDGHAPFRCMSARRVIPARLERAAGRLEICCSIQLSYGTVHKTLQKYEISQELQIFSDFLL